MNQTYLRYHRQMLLNGFGETGQRALAESTALIMGCGALGSVSAELLARAGVGHLIVADRDVVELTNLQRQTLFDERDALEAAPKAEAARRRLQRVNSAVRVTAVIDDINAASIARHAEGADILVDGLDNFDTRYLANDLAVKQGLPYVYGGAVGTAGIVFAVLPRTADATAPWEQHPGGSLATACLRCLFSEPPPPGSQPTCDTVGVLGPLTALVAAYQAAQVLKILTGHYAQVDRSLLTLDLWSNELSPLNVGGPESECVCCQRRRFEFLDENRGTGAATLCGRDAVQLTDGQRDQRLDLELLASRLHTHGSVRVSAHMLRAELSDRDTPFTLSLFPDGRAIIHGTSDPAVARKLYARFVGN